MKPSEILLEKPLSEEEMENQMKEYGNVSGIVEVELSEVIDRDLEAFLDLISERLTGSCLLMGTDYDIVNHSGNTLHICVRGDASSILDN